MVGTLRDWVDRGVILQARIISCLNGFFLTRNSIAEVNMKADECILFFSLIKAKEMFVDGPLLL
jgi:hypothetical protein